MLLGGYSCAFMVHSLCVTRPAEVAGIFAEGCSKSLDDPSKIAADVRTIKDLFITRSFLEIFTNPALLESYVARCVYCPLSVAALWRPVRPHHLRCNQTRPDPPRAAASACTLAHVDIGRSYRLIDGSDWRLGDW
jgi:hypothetical protein